MKYSWINIKENNIFHVFWIMFQPVTHVNTAAGEDAANLFTLAQLITVCRLLWTSTEEAEPNVSSQSFSGHILFNSTGLYLVFILHVFIYWL